VVTLPGGEIVPAMERGVIQGAEWINCEEDRKLGLHKVAKHYYSPGMHEPITGGQLIFNKDVWKKLPADLQEMSKAAAVYATTIRNQLLKQETAEACKDLIKQGVTMHRTPDEILRNFLNEWEKIRPSTRRRTRSTRRSPTASGNTPRRSCRTGCPGIRRTTSPASTTGRTRSTPSRSERFASRKRRTGAG
jgi:TRAP-type mannitol/chloroaromatic compound transport system substrate-binding protein